MSVPKDPVMLLSFLNLKLRDFYSNLEELCKDLGLEQTEIEEKLQSIDYEYDQEETNLCNHGELELRKHPRIAKKTASDAFFLA